MARDTVQGYVIVRKKWMARGYEVVGIGSDIPAAWRDAAENITQGRLDARQMIEEHPEMSSSTAKISITFEVKEGLK